MAKKKNVKGDDLKTQIKAMEQKKRDEQVKEVTPVKTDVTFDSWFHLRKNKIPKHHMKEIIWSYFKSKGLSKKEPIEKYDEELVKYGIKL